MAEDAEWFLLVQMSVVGIGFHAWRGRAHQFRQGLPVKIQAEPRNEHDQYALMVLAKPSGEEPSHVGYLPRGAKILSLMLQNGHKFRCEVAEDTSGVSPSVKIYMKKGS